MGLLGAGASTDSPNRLHPPFGRVGSEPLRASGAGGRRREERVESGEERRGEEEQRSVRSVGKRSKAGTFRDAESRRLASFTSCSTLNSLFSLSRSAPPRPLAKPRCRPSRREGEAGKTKHTEAGLQRNACWCGPLSRFIRPGRLVAQRNDCFLPHERIELPSKPRTGQYEPGPVAHCSGHCLSASGFT